MKKILLAAALMSMASISSFALTMTSNCTNSPLSIAPSGNSASGTLNCVGFPVALPAGATNVSYVFQYGVDFTVDQFNSSNPGMVFTFNNPGTALDVLNISSLVGSTGIVNVGFVTSTGADASYFAAFTSGFTSTVTSNITNVTINGRFLLNYDPAPTGIPEPSTVALMGAGLVGVAAFARRKR